MDWLSSPVIVVAIISAASAMVGIGMWIGKVNTNLSTFNTSLSQFMKEIRDDIKKIFERLPSPTLSGSSPLRLNDLELSISEKLEGRTWAERTAPQLVGKMRDKSPYEIQSQCFDFVEQSELDQSLYSAILDCAYENGISEDQVLDVLAIELRDTVLRLTGHHPDNIPNKR